LKPRRLYAQRHSFLSHALAMGNSPADLAAAAGHSTKIWQHFVYAFDPRSCISCVCVAWFTQSILLT